MHCVSNIFQCLSQKPPHSLGIAHPWITKISIFWLINPTWLICLLASAALHFFQFIFQGGGIFWIRCLGFELSDLGLVGQSSFSFALCLLWEVVETRLFSPQQKYSPAWIIFVFSQILGCVCAAKRSMASGSITGAYMVGVWFRWLCYPRIWKSLQGWQGCSVLFWESKGKAMCSSPNLACIDWSVLASPTWCSESGGWTCACIHLSIWSVLGLGWLFWCQKSSPQSSGWTDHTVFDTSTLKQLLSHWLGPAACHPS